MADLPKSADVVIVGGGAVGCAIAWALAAKGVRDVVVLEKAAVTHGSTWHAAGLVGQYRSREDLTRLMQSSVAIYDAFQAEEPVDWRPVGSLRIASSPARWQEFVAAEPVARRYGVAFSLLTPSDAKARFPFLSLDGVVGAAFVAGDGYVDPSSLTMAYARRARAGGARIVEGVAVRGFEHRGGKAAAVRTSAGTIACGTLVLAPGVWARPVGKMLGLDLPVVALEHQYAVTEKRDAISRELPALRDPDLNFYLKPEVGGFAIGGWDADTPAVHDNVMPEAFGRELLPENLDRLAPLIEAAARRLPIVGELGLRQVINGPIPVTPDGEPVLGPAPGWENVILAVGFTSGIAASGGAGRAIGEWIVDGKPAFALPSLDPSRFGKNAWPEKGLIAAAARAYAGYYALSGAAPMASGKLSS